MNYQSDDDLHRVPTRTLLRRYAAILTELKARGVVRSRNAPAGDLSETLVAAAYGGQIARQSEKSWDVLTTDGTRLQVKSRVMDSAKPKVGTFSPFRSWDFQACVFVVFDSQSYDIVRAVEMTVTDVKEIAKEAKWVAGHRVSVAQLSGRGVDVTTRIAQAYEAMDHHPDLEQPDGMDAA